MDRLQQEAQKAEEVLALARLELGSRQEGELGAGLGLEREGPWGLSGHLPSAPHLHPHSRGGARA